MTDTDIRAAFERAWRGRVREPINESKKDIAWTWYCHGRQQGQRELIEAMGEPIGHVFRAYDGSVQIESVGDPHISDGMLVYKLPDHLSKNPQNIDTSGGYGDEVKK